MIVLGISAYYHDSAAAIVRDGAIVNAAQEERFTRKKHDPGFPVNAIRWCLADAGVAARDIDRVAFYDKPFLKFERLLETYLAFAPRGFRSFRTAMPVWLSEKLFQKDMLLKELRAIDEELGAVDKLLFAEHHFSHAASAFYPSPFEEAAVLTMDGVGEWATTSAGDRARQRTHDRQGNPFSAFARPALFGLHLLHRLQGQFRRVQGHGARALWRAEIRADHFRQSDRPESRRLVPAQSRLFRLLHRPDHDQCEVRRAVRRPAAQAGSLARRNARWIWPPRSRR